MPFVTQLFPLQHDQGITLIPLHNENVSLQTIQRLSKKTSAKLSIWFRKFRVIYTVFSL